MISKVYYTFEDAYSLNRYFKYLKTYISSRVIPNYIYTSINSKVVILNRLEGRVEVADSPPIGSGEFLVKNILTLDEMTLIIESYDND